MLLWRRRTLLEYHLLQVIGRKIGQTVPIERLAIKRQFYVFL
jgi:hypothetical protein